MLAPTRASEEYEAQKRLTVATLAATRRQWARMGSDWDSSFSTVAPRLTAILAAAQVGSARQGAAYVPEVLDEQGMSPEPVARVRPESLAGYAADGRTLESLVSLTLLRSKVGGSLDSGGAFLDMVVETEIADAHRASIQLATVARPRTGYVRMVNTPCCKDCAVQAGKFFRSNAGFLRHPNCFPAGVAVNGPRSEAAARRWYEGELVVLTTASGQELPLTGNHPVLTRRGWVPANLIEEGDEVVRSTQPEGATPLVIPDHHQVPSRIENVWGALSVAGLDTVPTSPEDFHGDGQHGEVDVALADGALHHRALAAILEPLAQGDLTVASGAALTLDSQGSSVLLDLGNSPHAGTPVGGLDTLPALLGGHGREANRRGAASVTPLDARLREALAYGAARDAVLLGEGVLAGAGLVGGDDLLNREVMTLPRWDAPGGKLSVETSDGYTARGRDLLNRLAGQVELDRVVKLSRREFRGHVYSLTSSEGWHVANSLIVSNCKCYHLPTTDPGSKYATYPDPSEITGLTEGERKALEAGGDYSQVINASRGASSNKMTTTEGTTRRGVGYRAMGGAGRNDVRLPGERVRRTKNRRLTPDGIYAIASDDAEAIRLLKAHGYLT